MHGDLGGELGDELGDESRGELGDELGDESRGDLGGELGDESRGDLGGELGDELGDESRGDLGGELGDESRGGLGPLGSPVEGHGLSFSFGSGWAGFPPGPQRWMMAPVSASCWGVHAPLLHYSARRMWGGEPHGWWWSQCAHPGAVLWLSWSSPTGQLRQAAILLLLSVEVPDCLFGRRHQNRWVGYPAQF